MQLKTIAEWTPEEGDKCWVVSRDAQTYHTTWLDGAFTKVPHENVLGWIAAKDVTAAESQWLTSQCLAEGSPDGIGVTVGRMASQAMAERVDADVMSESSVGRTRPYVGEPELPTTPEVAVAELLEVQRQLAGLLSRVTESVGAITTVAVRDNRQA